MPILHSSIKKLRQTKKKTEQNRKIKAAFKKPLDAYKKNPSEKKLAELYFRLDKMAKTNIFHKNKVSRLKSRLAKKLKKSA